jgi:dienelactone hydrolase
LARGGWCAAESALETALNSATIKIAQWHNTTFIGPMDGQPWHALFYLQSVNQPQAIKRHLGILLRCTQAPIANKLIITIAFGAVLKTSRSGAITVAAQFDDRPREQLQLMTRNQANAELRGDASMKFLRQMLASAELGLAAKLSPQGRAQLLLPIASAHTSIKRMLRKCAIHATPLPVAPPSLAPRTQVVRAPKLSPLAEALIAYREAGSAEPQQQTIARLLTLAPDYATLEKALRSPLPVQDTSAARHLLSKQKIAGTDYPFHLLKPLDYDVQRAAPLFVFLHGGINRRAWRARQRWWPEDALVDDAFMLSPAGWRGAYWWSNAQTTNIEQLITRVKRQYNIDDNRVFVMGVSDGGAGALYLGMTAATQLAGVISIIGNPGVLYDRHLNRGPHPVWSNLTNLPLLFVNGALDPLFPPQLLAPFVKRLSSMNADFDLITQPETGHELNWNADLQRVVRTFVHTHPRTPHPTELYWEQYADSQYNRSYWLVVDKLSAGYPRGCVLAQRHDSVFNIETEGIEKMTLLIPSTIGGNAPIQVTLNGTEQHWPPEQSSIEVLLKWHSLSFDRTQLYGRELQLQPANNARESVCKEAAAARG